MTTPSADVRLGSFSLLEPLGRGGMGEVWRAVQVPSGVPAAVKLLTGPQANDAGARARFRREVQAAAALVHPGIVALLDYGEASEAAASAFGGRIVPGSPWLAMELASGGHLAAASGPGDWDALRELVLDLLDALAYAHARGVVHRDIKPGNVLLCSAVIGPWDDPSSPGLRGLRPKLADFGIAHSVRLDHVELGGMRIAGTPGFMAPEQINGSVRDHGPHTDLYALAALTWQLACGSPPFGTGTPMEILGRQITSEPGRFQPRFSVPAGFEGWLRCLMARRIGGRFSLAADAIDALYALDPRPRDHRALALSPWGDLDADAPPDRTGGAQASEDAATRTRLASELELWAPDTIGALEWSNLPPVPTTAPEEPPASAGSPGVMDLRAATDRGADEGRARSEPAWRDWRPSYEEPKLVITGAGLGLFDLREVPFTGRTAERDALWRLLRSVAVDGRPRAAVLHGPSGVGKSRLAEWIGQRANALGYAAFGVAGHDPHGGPGQGLGPALARLLRCTGLGRAGAFERLIAVLDGLPRHIASQELMQDTHWAAAALTEFMFPGTTDVAVPAVKFATPTERYTLMRRFLQVRTLRRPLVAIIDDAQWGHDSLGFVEHVLSGRERAPTAVLFLLTVRDDTLAERPLEQERLLALLERGNDAVVELSLGPLSDDELRQLMRRLLTLTPSLEEAVISHAGGNPALAVQMVGDWVREGRLVTAPHGFGFADDAPPSVAVDLHGLWLRRVRRLLDELAAEQTDRQWEALELAAVLGHEVHDEEWHAACAERGIKVLPGLHEALLARGLARERRSTSSLVWAFAEGILREALLRHAEEAGRRTALHRLCAERAARGGSPLAAERAALHYLDAGALHEAVAPLLAAARARRAGDELEAAEALLARRRDVLAELGVSPRDVRHGEGALVRVSCLRQAGRLSEASEAASALATDAAAHGWHALRGWALREWGRVADMMGEADGALLLAEAARIGEHLGDDALLAAARLSLGWCALRRDEPAAARKEGEAALAAFERVGDGLGTADTWLMLARAALRTGGDAEAAAAVETARRLYVQHGTKSGIALADNTLGEILRHCGQLEQAERVYERALALAEDSGSSSALHLRLSLGIVAIELGRNTAAVERLTRCRVDARASGMRPIEAEICAALAVAYGRAGDWPAATEARRRALVLANEVGRGSTELVALAERGLDVVRAAHRDEDVAESIELVRRVQAVCASTAFGLLAVAARDLRRDS